MASFEEAYTKVCYGPYNPVNLTQQRFQSLRREDARVILHGYLSGKWMLSWVIRHLLEDSLWITKRDLQRVLARPELDPYSVQNLTVEQQLILRMMGKQLGPILASARGRLEALR